MNTTKFTSAQLKDARPVAQISSVTAPKIGNFQTASNWRFLLINALVLIGLVSFLLIFRQQVNTDSLVSSSQNSLDNPPPAAARPIDQLSSTGIAISLAQLASFEEVYWIAEQSINAEYLAQSASATSPVADKPQLLSSNVKTRKDIINYVVSEGDSLDNLASRFSVSASSIRWSNDLTDNSLKAGQELVILPGFNGIVYQVKTSDTVNSILGRYNLSRAGLLSFNDIDNDLPVDELIFLPEATPRVSRPAQTAVAYSGYTPLYGASGYVYGHCTYYVATKISVPWGLGNANTWDDRAVAHGYVKTKTPVPGAIAQQDIGGGPSGWRYGHVAYVESVSADGGQIQYSDMNGLAGWNRVGHSSWVSKNHFDWYLVPPS